jgi:integrase
LRNANPFIQVYKKHKYKSGQKSLTPAQIQKFLEVIPDLVHLGLFQVALSTGIRREDIVRIKMKD